LNANIKVEFLNTIDAINSDHWQTLNQSNNPFLQYDFFKALEHSQSASAKTGWQPQHLVATANDEIIALMPMYLKDHSWGEYVFDWSWAEAYDQYRIPYYPKLVATIPFTPVSSNKLLAEQLDISHFFEALNTHCHQHALSSWHILYCEPITTPLPEDVYERNTVQFHWFNRDYTSFDDYLNTFTSRKRRSTRKERLTIAQQGITIRELKGEQITDKDLDFFYLTYQLTYLKRGHQPHLSIAFFKQIITTLSNNVLLLIASDQEEDVACALFFYDDEQLYGRYWGCTQQVNNLHFELCYYRGIEFCIQNNLKVFSPGTQGEHKIQRGFEPILTYSYHWIKHPGFKDAIKDFCQQEQAQMRTYQEECKELLPFRNAD